MDLSLYDVLVVGSTNAGGNFFSAGVSAANILDNKAEIEAARGNRTFLSGQDADWHYAFRGEVGAEGFLINAVNWAASGTGLGIVSMTDRFLANNGWWTDDDSFLKTELANAPFWQQSEDVDIGPGQDDFPINEGLTDALLSDWGTSSHACFDPVDGYTAINIAGPRAAFSAGDSTRTDVGCGVTIVTSAGAAGGTDGGDSTDMDDPNVIPLPAAGWLLIAGIAGLFSLRRRSA